MRTEARRRLSPAGSYPSAKGLKDPKPRGWVVRACTGEKPQAPAPEGKQLGNVAENVMAHLVSGYEHDFGVVALAIVVSYTTMRLEAPKPAT